MPEIRRFDPAGCAFPPPRVALLPALRWPDLARRGTLPRALLDGPGVRRFVRARYALRAACRAAGVGPGTVLLAPSYHCRTMLDPALALGAGVALYRLHADLAPDLASIEALLADGAPPARALLLPHYFGLEQPAAVMGALEELCRRHGLVLIEDCAHAWQVAQRRAAEGVRGAGRMVVASPSKYFACPDGGLLWADPAQLPGPGRAPGLLHELKAAARSRPRRAAPLPAPAAPDAGPCGAEHDEFSDRPSGHYDPALEQRDCLALTRWLMRRARPDDIAEQRRRHYRQWLAAVAGLAHARALLPLLPDNCAPYMFPLLISRPDPDFFRLKQAGLPIWRWDDMALSGCAVAARYRTELLHLPCHQGLGARQMAWMTALVSRVLA